MINKEIGDALTEEILFGRLTSGGTVQIDAKDKKLSFSYRSRKKGPRAKKRTPPSKKS